MLVLLVASALRDKLPAIVFGQPNELAEIHVAHRAEALGWAMSRKVRRARVAARQRKPRGSRNAGSAHLTKAPATGLSRKCRSLEGMRSDSRSTRTRSVSAPPAALAHGRAGRNAGPR
jgi:hypothetical protein